MHIIGKAKLSEKRREKISRASHAAAQQPGGVGHRSRHALEWRIAAVAAALVLATALAEHFLFGIAIHWLGAHWTNVKNIAGDSELLLFSSVASTFAIATLYGAGPTISGGIVASLALWAYMRFNPCTLACSLAGVFTVAFMTHRAKKPADVIISAFDAFLVQACVSAAVAALCIHKFDETPGEICELWQLAALAIFTAAAVPLAYYIARPLAEKISKRTAVCTLVPYTNLENPLLLRLSREAPGTYGHSMVVADLAAAAAEAIGANPILARLGGYYHDIGKLSNPRFFMENQTLLGNPHDALPPSISAMIISSHVKDGLLLAREHGLPLPIIRIIGSHHGTSPMEWFRRKAAKLAGEAGNPAAADEWPFRYAGLLPETAEETIVSIADSVEAASRSIPSPTQADLSRMVENIVTARFADGQFAHSALPLDCLEEVKRSLVRTLVHRLHARAAYEPAR